MALENKSTGKINAALIISICSLGLGVFTFYYNNFRIRNRLEAKISDYSIILKEGSKVSDTVVVRIFFANKGNKQCMLLQPWYELSDMAGSAYKTSILFTQKSFPLKLDPSEMRNLDFRIPLSEFNLNRKEHDSAVHTALFRIKMYGQDYNFVQHVAFSDYIIKVSFTENDILKIEESKQKKLEEYPAIKII